MFAFRMSRPMNFLALAILSAGSPALAQTGTVRGYPAGTALQQTPYYSAYYPVQYGYAYPPAASNPAAYQAAYPTIRLSPQAAYYAPAAAPTYAAAQPTANYTLAPAGGASAGAEAFAYYGQSTPLNYVAPTYSGYQTRVVQVPVTYYRPYTAYQPGVGVPTTCQRATLGTTCQPTQRRWFSCLDWLFHKKPCGTPAAAVPVATVPVAAVPAVVPRAVCYGNTCAPQCGTPYYNPVPPVNVVPGTVVPGATVVPGTTVAPPSVYPPRIISPGTIVPPPGTRTIPGVTVPSGTGDGADITPRLPPGTSVPVPNSFPGIGPSGASYRSDTQRRSVNTLGTGRENGQSPYSGPALSQPSISEPSLGPRRSVQPVPDPAASQPRERSTPVNRAPQLIAPNDRTAAVAPRLPGGGARDVIPAQWPEKSMTMSPAEARSSIQPVSRQVSVPATKVWDDTLWKSAAE
jgi:hypothetical protein